MIAKDDPVFLANYAKQNGLLEAPGWKFLRHIARQAKKLQHMLYQSRCQSKHNAIQYKFGVRIPRDVKEAYELDRQNGNTFWADAIQCELNQVFKYDTFHDKGQLQKTPNGYQLIRCHFVFDVKQSGKCKARFVASGHMTNPAKDSIYSGVVSL